MSESVPLPDFPAGHVWLCGAGPGDAGLLTLHAVNALKQADVIVHDALIGADILALGLPAAERIYVGKRGGQSATQTQISQRLVELAQTGKRVLRLKGGDPFMFGRGGEEAQVLAAANIPWRIIPGVTAGIGGLAMAGIPVTHRDVNQAAIFATGHDPATDWAAIARAAPVIVIYMGLKRIGDIARILIKAGRGADTPVAIVTDASLPTQKILQTTLGRIADDLAAHPVSPPAVICIGGTVDILENSNG
ncbi:uroporphyrinogen-III C-methyltransferase [Profundibacter amoris]|uniref:uroporphyrinogen-III C-methyltransferase n=1 Tax=Profundibacter amoris TaxID=2171755 RepID=A0A347UFY0_9RHOB|nr:uroporphyrinogen-III C-methyltransferase [Profundibacter amoris]AXX97758.1 uroporphyrinogen-III C-methyltransferase [Profundibacter amoris]